MLFPIPTPPLQKKGKKRKKNEEGKANEQKNKRTKGNILLSKLALLHFFFFKQPANYTNFNQFRLF